MADTDTQGSSRTCIVTRKSQSPDGMIRFALSPEGIVTPDLKQRLPGRGVWVGASAELVAQAAKRRAFERGFKTKARVPHDLVETIDRLLETDCLQSLSIANKAGLVVAGSAKAQAEIGAGAICALIQASDGGADGKRKFAQALRRRFGDASPPEVEIFASRQLDLALGRTNVIHAALRMGAASEAFLARCRRLAVFRQNVENESVVDENVVDTRGEDESNRPSPRTQD